MEKVKNTSVAILIQALFWLFVSIVVQKLWESKTLTCSVLIFGILDLTYRFCLISLTDVKNINPNVIELLNESYLRSIDSSKRIAIYIIFQATIFLIGVLITLSFGDLKEESWLMIGAFLCLISYLKLVPIYPTDGAIILEQIYRFKTSYTRIFFECLGYVVLAILGTILISPLFGGLFLVPIFLLPLRVQTLAAKYSILDQVSDYILNSNAEVSDHELFEKIYSIKEFQNLKLIYNEEEQNFFVDILTKEIPKFPPRIKTKKTLFRAYIIVLLTQSVLLFNLIEVYLTTGKLKVNSYLNAGDCSSAKQTFKGYKNLIDLAGDYPELKKKLLKCKEGNKDLLLN